MILSFFKYFIVGFIAGIALSMFGGFFHNAPDIMWKETLIFSLFFGIVIGIRGEKLLNWLSKFYWCDFFGFINEIVNLAGRLN